MKHHAMAIKWKLEVAPHTLLILEADGYVVTSANLSPRRVQLVLTERLDGVQSLSE
jgi:hypothetical protein